MKITPDSTITLYSGVGIDNGEQLIFKSASTQQTYFASKAVAGVIDCQVVKKTGRIKIPLSPNNITGELLSTCNYFSFINPSFDNKIFYCRIIDYDYLNNECAELSWVIDMWQTWMFDVNFDAMYIEREHLSTADYNKLVTNPYDTSVFEMRTAEPLPIGEDLEKLMYTIGTNSASDGILIREAISTFAGKDPQPGTLMYLADIDFEDLDTNVPTGTNPPSSRFAAILSSIESEEYAFYKLTPAQYSYLISQGYSVNLEFTGTGWTSLNISPFDSNILEEQYTILYMPFTESNYDPSDPNSVYSVPPASLLINSLTQWNCVSAIIGLYGIPTNLMITAGLRGGSGDYGAFYAQIETPKNSLSTVHNKKLLHYPFSYLRLISPCGDKCELRYENFQSVQTSGASCNILINMDIYEKPTLIVAPDDYKMDGLTPASTLMSANVLSGLIFNQFPQMPYTVDSFLAQMSAVASDIVQHNTTDYGYSLEQKQLDVYKEGAGAIASTIGAVSDAVKLNISGAASNAVNATFGAAQTELSQRRLQNEANMSQDAYALLAGEQEGNAVFENFKNVRPAFAANRYVQSNGDGTINYNVMNTLDIIILKVTLNSAVLAQYDKWFTQYGYTSGRCGIPHVLNYIDNTSYNDGSGAVNWETDGTKQFTYVKTHDCKVLDVMLPVSQFIKQMFDGGIKLVKGD